MGLKYLFPVLVLSLVGLPAAWALELESPAFKDGEYIPKKYSYGSYNSSPPLVWKNAPEGTLGFCLICDDPDAPGGSWVHWVISNIPADSRELEEDIPKSEFLSDGTMQGNNDFKRIGWGGPAPPPGKPHRYVFTLYAVDRRLNTNERMNKDSVLDAIKGHILAEAQLIALYKN